MEFSALFILVVCTTSMTYLTFGKERERAMLFPDYYFFAKRRLENYTIETRKAKNLDDCELMCYLNDNCVSLNFKKLSDNNEQVHICELNNATHLKYDSDLTTDANFYYRGSKNACDKSSQCQNNATCQSGFTPMGYRCLCPPGFEGEHCEKDVDECKGNHSCHENANCTNTIGSHVCCCQSGYTGNGRNCTDIDECSDARVFEVKKCHLNASCINTQGSYNCSCNPKHIGDGFNCKADPCHHYSNLSEADRNKERDTPPQVTSFCDNKLSKGWYRFVGAAGARMPTMRVEPYHCYTDWSGWLDGTHPKVEDGEVERMVCFSNRPSGCKYRKEISVKNCGSYFIYKLQQPACSSRYCGTD